MLAFVGDANDGRLIVDCALGVDGAVSGLASIGDSLRRLLGEDAIDFPDILYRFNSIFIVTTIDGCIAINLNLRKAYVARVVIVGCWSRTQFGNGRDLEGFRFSDTLNSTSHQHCCGIQYQ
jgi:hypothetical protein